MQHTNSICSAKSKIIISSITAVIAIIYPIYVVSLCHIVYSRPWRRNSDRQLKSICWVRNENKIVSLQLHPTLQMLSELFNSETAGLTWKASTTNFSFQLYDQLQPANPNAFRLPSQLKMMISHTKWCRHMNCYCVKIQSQVFIIFCVCLFRLKVDNARYCWRFQRLSLQSCLRNSRVVVNKGAPLIAGDVRW